MSLIILKTPILQAQNKFASPSINASIEGKTFIITLYTIDSNGVKNIVGPIDEITFVGNKFHIKNRGKEYNLTDGNYNCHSDSSSKTQSIGFVSFSMKENGAIDIFWKGKIIGNTIKGTLHWFSQEKTLMFSGSLKYSTKEK